MDTCTHFVVTHSHWHVSFCETHAIRYAGIYIEVAYLLVKSCGGGGNPLELLAFLLLTKMLRKIIIWISRSRFLVDLNEKIRQQVFPIHGRAHKHWQTKRLQSANCTVFPLPLNKVPFIIQIIYSKNVSSEVTRSSYHVISCAIVYRQGSTNYR